LPYASLVRRLFSTFAHGGPGIGLLLLRLTTGSTLIYHGVAPLVRHAPFAPAALHVLVILLGVLLLAGLWTPIAGALVAVITLWEMVSHPASWSKGAWIAIIAAALALLGPGAWSVDARLYGWKQIKISDRRPSGRDSPT
jgi:putative oxidoreductase